MSRRDFLVLYVCVAKLEYICYAVNFCGKYVCGNFYLLELFFADR